MNRILLLTLLVFFTLPAQGFEFKNLFDGLTGSPPTECQYEKASQGYRINTDDPKYPLEFVEDCYKFVRFFEEPVTNKKSGELLYITKKAEWRWKYSVRNKSDGAMTVHVTYELKDEDDFVIAEDAASVYVAPKDTATLSGKILMDKDIAGKVSDSGWTISYSEIEK